MLKILNTLTNQKEVFKPIDDCVRMYNCGLTVYDYPHVGNLRSYTMADIIRRVLEFLDYSVIQVMNFTDVGHLTDDGNHGDDKIEKGAKKMNKTVWEVAQFFIDHAMSDFSKMNFEEPEFRPRATDHISIQIEMIEKLILLGYAYETSEAIYFDTSKFENYGELRNQDSSSRLVGARKEVEIDKEKINPEDFRLWQKAVGANADHSMKWDSPWGLGFPGWHIECSAMAYAYLGETIDIHTGGIDHIPVHHTNEIAQSQAYTDKQFVKYWYHNQFLKINGKKMSKSLGNYYTLSDLEKLGYSPMHLRYFFFTANFRKPQNLTMQGLDSAKSAYEKLVNFMHEIRIDGYREIIPLAIMKEIPQFQQFTDAICDSFNMPLALSAVWSVVNDKEIKPKIKFEILREFDRVLGFKL